MLKWISAVAIGSTASWYVTQYNSDNKFKNENNSTSDMNGLITNINYTLSSNNNNWPINNEYDVIDSEIYTPKYRFDDFKTNSNLISSYNNLKLSNYSNTESLLINLNSLPNDNNLVGYKSNSILSMNDTSTSFGYNSLHERIKLVKNDLNKLTDKINNYPSETNDGNELSHGSYYNMRASDFIIDADDNYLGSVNHMTDLDDDEDDEHKNKTWRCPSEFNNTNRNDRRDNSNNTNPYSELSEHTQKILSRLNIKSQHDELLENDEFNLEENEFEMEEDNIEFTIPISTQQRMVAGAGMIQSFLSQTSSLPIIEETEEPLTSSSSSGSEGEEDEDQSSRRSELIEDDTLVQDNKATGGGEEDEDDKTQLTVTPYSTLSRDINASKQPSEDTSYITAKSHLSPSTTSESHQQLQGHYYVNGRKKDDGNQDDEDTDDTDEYYSDFATSGSVSSGDTMMNLQLQQADEMMADGFHNSTPDNKKDPEPELNRTLTPTNTLLLSQMNENDDAVKNVEETHEEDDMIEMIENDVLEQEIDDEDEEDDYSFPPININRPSNISDKMSHINRSTDLDELFESLNLASIDKHESGLVSDVSNNNNHDNVNYNTSSIEEKSRLSLSMGNLNSLNSNHTQKLHSNDRIDSNQGAMYGSVVLFETDIDSGYVSLYQPTSANSNQNDRIQMASSQVIYRETELVAPRLNFGGSLANITDDSNSDHTQHTLVQHLKNRASSIPELRVADSLSKLNVPDWLNNNPNLIGDSVTNQNTGSNSVTRGGQLLHHSLPISSQTTPPCLKKYRQHNNNNNNTLSSTTSSTNRSTSLNRHYQTSKSLNYRSTPTSISSSLSNKESLQNYNKFVLPSHSLRQQHSYNNKSSKLKPITGCKARSLLPNKISIDAINRT